MNEEIKICLVTSGGGHLFHLQELQEWWKKYNRFWVAPPHPDVKSILKKETIYWSHSPVTRNVKNLFKNTFLALKVLLREKPNLIISTGGGVAIPFFWIGGLLDAKLVFIEVYDSFAKPSWTGKLVYPITHYFFLQLEEQKKLFPKGEVLGPIFQELR